MKHAATALAVAMLVLAGTPVKAENPAEPGAPCSDKTLGDAKSAQTPPATTKNTGALNPDTPDPTKNTPGAEPKN